MDGSGALITCNEAMVVGTGAGPRVIDEPETGISAVGTETGCGSGRGHAARSCEPVDDGSRRTGRGGGSGSGSGKRCLNMKELR